MATRVTYNGRDRQQGPREVRSKTCQLGTEDIARDSPVSFLDGHGNKKYTHRVVLQAQPINGEAREEDCEVRNSGDIVIPNLDPADPNDRFIPPEAPQDEGHDENDKDPFEKDERARPKNFSSVKAIVVNERRMMEEHNSYHQSITGKEAEKRLKKCGNHCYLTRYSVKRECYMLSVYQKKPTYVMKHFEIFFEHFEDHKMYKIQGKTKELNGIGPMLHHYENNRIDPSLRSIGRGITEQEFTSKWCTIL